MTIIIILSLASYCDWNSGRRVESLRLTQPPCYAFACMGQYFGNLLICTVLLNSTCASLARCPHTWKAQSFVVTTIGQLAWARFSITVFQRKMRISKRKNEKDSQNISSRADLIVSFVLRDYIELLIHLRMNRIVARTAAPCSVVGAKTLHLCRGLRATVTAR